MKVRQRVEAWLGDRRALGIIVFVGVLLAAASLDTGLVGDDYFQAIVLRGTPKIDGMPANALDLFSFARGEPRSMQAVMDSGFFPWTADPALRLAFFRPLSSLTHALDYRLWPSSPFLMHVQSLAWFALALLIVGLVYRRFLGVPWVAALAALLYAVDDAHGPAVGWIANRNAIVSLAIALPALLFHDRWRRDRWRPGPWLASLSLAIGLLAGESAVAVCAYLFAYALHIERGTLRARVASLAPYAIVVVLWRITYGALGYGASGSGVYFDPGRDPIGFIGALPKRLPSLLVGQIALPWSDAATLAEFSTPVIALALALVTFAVLAAFAIFAWPLVRRDPVARFFATGMVLAAIPVCSIFPADRLLLFVGVGGMGLVAQLIASASPGRFARIATGLLVAVHLVLSPPMLAVRSRSNITVRAPTDFADKTIPRTDDIAEKTIVLVDPPNDLFAAYVMMTRAALGETRPARMRALASGGGTVSVTRLDANTVLLRPQRGFMERISEQMLRGRRHPLRAGDQVKIAGMTATVTLSLADGRPSAIAFRFDTPLDDPSFVWLEWSPRGYEPFPLPKIGETTILAGEEFLDAANDAMKAMDR